MIATAVLWIAGGVLAIYGAAMGVWWLSVVGVAVVGVGGYRPLGLVLWHGVMFLREGDR